MQIGREYNLQAETSGGRFIRREVHQAGDVTVGEASKGA